MCVFVVLIAFIRLSLKVFTQFEPGGCASVIVIDPPQPGFGSVGSLLEAEVEIEEPVIHLDVISTFYQDGP